MEHEKYFKTLGTMARDLPRVFRAQISAGIVYKNEFISFGSNQLKTHPFQQKFSKHEDAIYLHAETDAIKNALKVLTQDQLARSTLYVCRLKQVSSEDTKKVWGLAKPCLGCQRAISTFGIRNVYFTTDRENHFECM